MSRKLATDCTPPLAREESRGGSASAFSSDPFVDGGNANVTENDDIHRCEDAKPTISLSVAPQGNSYQVSATVTQGTHPLSSAAFPGTVNFSIDGTVIKSVQVGGPGSIAAFSYTPTFTGPKQMTAQVIDSVLYESSDVKTVTGAASTSPTTSSLKVTKAKQSGVETKFTWTGGSGGVSIKKSSDNSTLCNGGPNGDCPVPFAEAPPGTSVYAEDSAGNTSPAVTVSGP